MIVEVISRVARLSIAALLSLASLDVVACSGALHIEIQDAGVYALDYASVIARQPQLADCASADLRLSNRGKDVPIRVVDDTHGKFSAGSSIQWVAQALHGPLSFYDMYSTVNVYRLDAVAGAHARMRETTNVSTAAPATLVRRLHLEKENLMIRLSDREMAAGEEPDVWQWAKLTPVDPQPFSYTFDLADIDVRAAAAQNSPVTMTLDFRGLSNLGAGALKPIDHTVEISLNGKPLPAQSWDGRAEVRKQLVLPVAALKDKGNVLTLHIPQRAGTDKSGNFLVDVVMFNWVEVNYPLRGNLDASAAPLQRESNAPIELESHAAQAPQLYGDRGTFSNMHPAGAGRYRADGFGAGEEIYPVTEGRLLAPTLVRAVSDKHLRDDDTGYDYVIVAHPRLKEAIEPLAQYHRDHGLRVAVVDVNDVYDEFSDGIQHPGAIRDLLAWGVQHWTVKPRYLLLVGDASFDIRHDIRTNRPQTTSFAPGATQPSVELMRPGNFFAMDTTSYSTWDPDLANRNLVPTWQFPSPEGQSASDNGFATLEPGSDKPSIAVGRLPVVTADEVQAIVKKTISYAERSTQGPWHRDVTLISTDEVASFKSGSDRIGADLSQRGYSVNNIYTHADGKDVISTHEALKQDLDTGNLLVHFIGHGGQFIWRVGQPADLFTLADVGKLQNVGRYPIVLAMTCFSAPFDNPTEDSIGERFLREPDKGAVAVFAASWTNSPNPQDSDILIHELLKVGNPIGDAVVAAKRQIANRVFVQMYNLLGDPALVLTRPQGKLEFMRSTDRWNRQLSVRIPERDFGGQIVVDWLDAKGITLSSHEYEARDAQFSISSNDAKAFSARVYANNPRTGFDAFGSVAIDEPAPVAASPTAIPLMMRKPSPARRTIAHADAESEKNNAARTAKMPDSIMQSAFDAPGAHAALIKPAPAARSETIK